MCLGIDDGPQSAQPEPPVDWFMWVLIVIVVLTLIGVILMSPVGTFPLRR